MQLWCIQWTTKGWNIVNRQVKNPNFTLKHQTFAYLKTYLIKKKKEKEIEKRRRNREKRKKKENRNLTPQMYKI